MGTGKKIYNDVSLGSHEPWMTMAGESEGLHKTHPNRSTRLRERDCVFGSVGRGTGTEAV